MRGAEIKARLSVSFEEAMKGAKKRVSLPNGKSLEVGVPAGVESGKVLRLRGQGHPGRDGGPAGDALIEIVIAEHPWFRREGDNIRLDLPISLKEALFGGAVRAPTVDGMVEVRVPAGANSGAQLRLRGKGAPKSEAGAATRSSALSSTCRSTIPISKPLSRTGRRRRVMIRESVSCHDASTSRRNPVSRVQHAFSPDPSLSLS